MQETCQQEIRPPGHVSCAGRGTAIVAADHRLCAVLAELIRTAGLARRIGIRLRQAIEKLNETGQLPSGLLPDVADSLHRSIVSGPAPDRAPVTSPPARSCSFQAGRRVPAPRNVARNGWNAFWPDERIIWTIWTAGGPPRRIAQDRLDARRIAIRLGWTGV